MLPNDGRVVSNFIVQALQNNDITIYGDGRQTRSFQFVDDLVEGMIRMMNSRKEFLGPVNLGNPNEFTMLELYQAYGDYKDMMDLTEEIFEKTSLEINNSTKVYKQFSGVAPLTDNTSCQICFAKSVGLINFLSFN